MGRRTFSVSDYQQASSDWLTRSQGRPVTAGAEREARLSGKLDPLVDPAGFNVIRRSLPRLEQLDNGQYELTVGTPMPSETRLDTTGSMGDNVDKAFRVLPQLYKLCSRALPGYDLHELVGIFGDVYSDRFPLCRPQFEATDDKILNQLTLLVPERGGGGNGGEDPHYGLFGAAYLVAAYANRIGLGRYDFTISDEPARTTLDSRYVRALFGPDVFERCKANGFDIDPNDLPSTREVVADLIQQAHAFFLEVEGWDSSTHAFWERVYGRERMVLLPSVDVLPQVQAVIIGLTEGTFGLDQIGDFLAESRIEQRYIRAITRAVSHIPLGAQRLRPGFGKQPQQGAVFADKPDVFKGTNLWPIDSGAVLAEPPVVRPRPPFPGSPGNAPGPDWL